MVPSVFAKPFRKSRGLCNAGILGLLLASNLVFAEARDPGVRGGEPGAGHPHPGLNQNALDIFEVAKQRFQEVEATCENCKDFPIGTPAPPGMTNSAGLGGRFNSDQCSSCHMQPAIGGSSPAVNPLFEVASRRGGRNYMPSFEQIDGPVREVRRIYDEKGERDGGVLNLFVLTGRHDAPHCQLTQPDFEREHANGNLAFRIPTPLFGLGLIDSIPDSVIIAQMESDRLWKAELGIKGRPNRNDHDGTITRLGWKAQNKSAMIFSGEAYNVEMGVTNELFPTPREEDPQCSFGSPQDVMRTEDLAFTNNLQMHASWVYFGMFARLLGAPKPVPFTPSARRGEQVFKDVGCAACHTPALYTQSGNPGPSIHAFSGQEVPLYSDLLLHHMGDGLADNISQGRAGPDEFRTAPLWGLGQRIFFLHDGRTSNLAAAILAHYSMPTEVDVVRRRPAFPPSEGNGSVLRYIALSESEKQALFNFLRSL